MFRTCSYLRAFRYVARDVIIPPTHYTVTGVRGSGPGGQGVNRSSNKAEVRMGLSQGLPNIDADVWVKFREMHHKHITVDDVLVLTSHEHRSLQSNVDACLDKIRDMVVAASFVAPAVVAVDMDMPSWKKDQVIQIKRQKGSKNKASIMRSLNK